jgi:hypothetical protein
VKPCYYDIPILTCDGCKSFLLRLAIDCVVLYVFCWTVSILFPEGEGGFDLVRNCYVLFSQLLFCSENRGISSFEQLPGMLHFHLLIFI